MHEKIHIDPTLVERMLLEMAEYGSDGGTGVSRTVYSQEWVGAAALYSRWCEEAGLQTRMDAVGNVWGRLAYRHADPGRTL